MTRVTKYKLGFMGLIMAGLLFTWTAGRSAHLRAPNGIAPETSGVDVMGSNSAANELEFGRRGNVQEPPAFALIDDMTTRAGEIDGPGLMGFWYTYSDGTAAVHPREGLREYPVSNYKGKWAREFICGGQTDWGAGFGFDLTRLADAGLKRPIVDSLDASEYEGIRFEAASLKGPVLMEVNFSDSRSNPHGGFCNPSSRGPDQCYADFGTRVRVRADDWETLAVSFSSLQLPTWSLPLYSEPPRFRKDKLFGIHFQVHHSAIEPPLRDCDLLIANVQFVRSL